MHLESLWGELLYLRNSAPPAMCLSGVSSFLDDLLKALVTKEDRLGVASFYSLRLSPCNYVR